MDAPETNTLATLLLRADQWKTTIAALLFSVGSLFFTALLLRGWVIPRSLAWLGLLASIILVLCLPLQLGMCLPRTVATWMWIPMLLFEVPAGVWLIMKGGAASAAKAPT